MAKFFNQLTQDHKDFISRQQMFFTATAPQQGRVNVSPKGMDTFRILDDHTVGYLDLTGSGNETAAHINQNGRVTFMFCSFDKQPLILRIYGTGRCISPRHAHWDEHIQHFAPLTGTRQIIIATVQSVQTSCGYAVPLFEYAGERDTLTRWAENKGHEGLKRYWQDKNQTSIDGLSTKLFD
jgi:hypothetical protein